MTPLRGIAICLLLLPMAWLGWALVATPGNLIIIWPDSLHYLDIDIRRLDLAQVESTLPRPFFYFLIVYILSWAGVTLPDLATLQNGMLWLAMATLCSVAWRCWRLAAPEGWRGLALAAGLMLCQAPVALHLSLTGLAHAVMPETLFFFLTTLACLCLLQSLLHARAGAGPNRAALWAGGYLACSFALVTVKPHWAPGLAVSLLAAPWAAGLLSPSPHRRRRLLALGLWALVAALATLGVNQRLKRTDQGPGTLFLYQTLGSIHLPMVVAWLEEKGAGWNHGEALRQDLAQEGRAILAAGPASGYLLLGFDGDAFMYGEAGARIRRHFGGDTVAMTRFHRDLFLNALRHRPGLYLEKVATQTWWALRHPFHDMRSALWSDTAILARHPLPPELLGDAHTGEPVKIDFPAPLDYGIHGRIEEACNLLFLACLAAGLLLLPRRPRCPDEALARRFFLCLLATHLGLALFIAMIHCFDPLRYLYIQVAFPVLLMMATMLRLATRYGIAGRTTEKTA